MSVQVVVEIPYVFVETVLYTLIVYLMMSFQWTSVKFLWFFYVSFLTFLYFTYYGMMTVSISPNGQVASIFAAAFYAFFNLFSGFFVARSVSHFSFLLTNNLLKNSKVLPLLSVYVNLIYTLFFTSENPKMVDLVLLALPGGMDSLRACCVTIRRCGGYDQGAWSTRSAGWTIHQELLRL